MTELTPTSPDESPFDLINNLEFCVFDLETTGGNHKTDKIIEIGLVKIKNLQVIDQKNYLIQPEIKIPDFIQKLTNITPQDVKSAPLIEDVIDEILVFMGDSILVAHNTSFDVPFFNSVLLRLGKPVLENKSLCTNLMTKYLIPHLMNSNLNYMSKIFHISHNQAHRALDDAIATSELLLIYLNIFIDKGIQKINHLYYPRNRYELDRANFKKSDDLKLIKKKLSSLKSPYLWTLKGENGIILHSLPCRGSATECDYLLSKLETMDWEGVTIRLVGPFMEGVIAFNSLFNKLESQIKKETLDFLWNEHLAGKRPNKSAVNITDGHLEMETLVEKEYGDFFITHHLVPDQFIIYPLCSMTPKSALVFRFPGHQKKLLQYINSKSLRISNNKLKRTHFHPQLMEFIEQHIIHDQQNRPELFIFKKQLAQKRSEEFLETLEKFIADHPNPGLFPKDYI
jgi:DNA polymerase-3 subunit epsilon